MKGINKKILLTIIIIALITLVVSIFFYQICIIHGDSMIPTLKDKQIAIIKKFDLNLKYNDIIVAKKNGKIIIKRLVGLPKDSVEIKDYLYINGEKFDDYYTPRGEIKNKKIILSNDEYFVLGDNREHSIDSRFSEIGIIKKEEIIGKIIIK